MVSTINSLPPPYNTSSIMLVSLNDQMFQPIFLNISLDTSPRVRPIDRITTEEVIIVAMTARSTLLPRQQGRPQGHDYKADLVHGSNYKVDFVATMIKSTLRPQ